MSTNKHLDAIDDAVSDIETWPDDRGVVTVRAETIRKHANALVTENADLMRQLNAESDVQAMMRDELAAERARVKRMQSAYLAIEQYAWAEALTTGDTKEAAIQRFRAAHGVQPGDLSDEEATQ